MINTAKQFFTCLIFIFLLCPLAQGRATPSAAGIVINEIAWAGTTENWREEWIELFNVSGSPVDIAGWQIDNAASGNEPLILGEPGQGALYIEAGRYFLICRAGLALSLPSEAAGCDIVETKTSLHNQYDKNGQLVLRDSAGNLIDSTPLPDPSAGSGQAWPGGDNETKQTMERTNTSPSASSGQAWQTSQEPNGTPKTENSTLSGSPRPRMQSEAEDCLWAECAASSTNISAQKPQLAQSPAYPSGIYINEVMPSPKGADSEEEWLELYNNNDIEVNLAGWQIRDTVGQVKTYICPTGTIIKPQGFLLVKRPESQIALQNSGDKLELLAPHGQVIHSAEWPKAPQGQAYARYNNGWAWTNSPTPGQKNIITQPALNGSTKNSSGFKTETAKDQPPETQTTASQLSEKALAQASQGLLVRQAGLPQKSSRLLTIMAAMAIALLSAIVVLIIKQKANKPI